MQQFGEFPIQPLIGEHSSALEAGYSLCIHTQTFHRAGPTDPENPVDSVVSENTFVIVDTVYYGGRFGGLATKTFRHVVAGLSHQYKNFCILV